LRAASEPGAADLDDIWTLVPLQCRTLRPLPGAKLGVARAAHDAFLPQDRKRHAFALRLLPQGTRDVGLGFGETIGNRIETVVFSVLCRSSRKCLSILRNKRP
jgi:hypothetical protein